MKWTDEQLSKLRKLSQDGVPNKAIAEVIGVAVTDVYAKRSQLGITIDKVRANNEGQVPEQAPEAVGRALRDKINSEIEQKKRLLRLLLPALQFADPEVVGLSITRDGNHVEIQFKSGIRMVNIECDSPLAAIIDITRHILY